MVSVRPTRWTESLIGESDGPKIRRLGGCQDMDTTEWQGSVYKYISSRRLSGGVRIGLNIRRDRIASHSLCLAVPSHHRCAS